MPTIGVDLDGVVGDFTSHFAQFVFERGSEGDRGRVFPPPDSWHFGNWNLETDFEVYYEQFIEAGQYRHMPLIHGAVATLEIIRNLGWQVHIITNRGTSIGKAKRNYRAQTDTLLWLQSIELPFDLISFVKDKTAICCDVMVEDAPHHLEKFSTRRYEQNITQNVLAMAQPYNKEFRHSSYVTYAQDWNDVLDHVRKLTLFLKDEDGQDRLSR